MNATTTRQRSRPRRRPAWASWSTRPFRFLLAHDHSRKPVPTFWDHALAPRGEEVAQQSRAFAFADAAIDFRPVMAGGLRKEPHAIFHRPAFWIARAEIKPPDTRERHCRRAHGAGLQRHIEIAVGKPLTTQRGR